MNIPPDDEFYPHVLPGHGRIPFYPPKRVLAQFDWLSAQPETEVSIAREALTIVTAGRIIAVRAHGEIAFVDIEYGAEKLQIVLRGKQYNNKPLAEFVAVMGRGDWYAFTGTVMVTKSGQRSIAAVGIQLLAPCLVDFPAVLQDQETRHRNRPLDLAINPDSRKVLADRATIIGAIRKYCCEELKLLEVETPVLQLQAGGATAKPFCTHHNDLNLPMQLRVAPELYLKRLCVGGIEGGVFEIGKNFRNEGIDRTHNPEFTAIELYWVFHDYRDLMAMTQQMLFSVVKALGYSDGMFTCPDGTVLAFDAPFPCLSVVDELAREWERTPLEAGEKVLGRDFPATRNMDTEETRLFFVAWCERLRLRVEAPQTTARLLDKLIGHFIEPRCVQPTFIIDHPQVMCPLAKSHRSRAGLTERFELFIRGLEYCNAYTELNNPTVQRREFGKQLGAANQGDEEAQLPDEDYCQALDLGLPPTAGWGMGIDRLVMLLTKCDSIRDAIAFPAMRPLPRDQSKQLTDEQRARISYHAHYQKVPDIDEAARMSPGPSEVAVRSRIVYKPRPEYAASGAIDADRLFVTDGEIIDPRSLSDRLDPMVRLYQIPPTITIRRETKNAWEGRAALSPAHVRKLIDSGIIVRVQRSATRAYTDGEYHRAGAELIDQLSDRDVVIVGLKELPVGDMHANRLYMCFSHTFKGQPAGAYRIQAMARHNITLIDYELIRDKQAYAADPNTLARAMKFGPYAGIGGLFDTFHNLGLRLLDRGIRTPFVHVESAYGLPSLEEDGYPRLQKVGKMVRENGLPDALLPFVTVFISRGAVSANALEAFKHMAPVEVRPDELATLGQRPIEEQRRTLYYAVLTHEHLVERVDGAPFDKAAYYEDGRSDTATRTHRAIFHERYLPYISVIINGAFWNSTFPRIITCDQARSHAKRLLALGDLGCDIRGPFEFFSHSTRIRDPVYYYNTQTGEEHQRRDDPAPESVMVYGVDHVPGELAKDATDYFGNLFMPYVEQVARHDQRVPYAEIKDLAPELLNAMQTRHGRIVGRYAEVVKKAVEALTDAPTAERDAADLSD